MWCISISHCLGAAVGSLETCTHVILMPESHSPSLVFNTPKFGPDFLFPHVPMMTKT